MSCILSIFTFVYLSLAACSAAPQSAGVVQPNNGTRIIGGRPTTIDRYPFAVQVNQNNQLICGGTLVSRRCVLSAAHCFVSRRASSVSPNLKGVVLLYGKRVVPYAVALLRDNRVPNANLYSARLGTATLNTGGTLLRLTTIVVHERYNIDSHENDIAIMVLRSNVTLSSAIQLSPLPLQASYLPDNVTLVHIGWGRTDMNSPTVSPILNEVEVRKVNQATCAQRYRALGHLVTSNMICAGLLDIGGADACQGDSGGPLLYSGVVVGVTSWGHGCGDPVFPGVSARVANYSAWIDAQILRYNSSPASGVLNALVLMMSLAATLIVLK